MNPVGVLRDAYTELCDNYDNPVWRRGRVGQRVVRPVHRIYPGYDDSILVMAEDWDTLIVLDACRADLFEEVADFDEFDDYWRVTSAGSMTREWTQRNFAGRSFGDTVYVSSNPYITMLAGDAFHDLREVWRDEFDQVERTVLPKVVAEAARVASEEYPDKRLVVHFMQPHYPFIDHSELRYQSWSPKEVLDEERGGGEHPHDPWQALELQLVDRNVVWEAYADNLALGLNAALALATSLDGRTVLTSDHGNMIGERAWPIPIRFFGHPEGIRHPALVDVPWAVIEGEERRSVTDEGINPVEMAPTETVKDRLRNLGYAE